MKLRADLISQVVSYSAPSDTLSAMQALHLGIASSSMSVRAFVDRSTRYLGSDSLNMPQ
jgi:hypothetical protein